MTNITALMTTHNSAETIRVCMNTLTEFSEVIVYDDESTDDTVNIIASEYPSATIITKPSERIHLNKMRQRLAELALTDWVVYQDSDDWRMLNVLHRYERCFKHCDVLITPSIKVTPNELTRVISHEGDLISDLALCTIQTNGILWKTSTLRSIDFKEEASGEYSMLYEAHKNGAKIAYSQVSGSIYTGGGLYSKQNSVKQLKSHLRLMEEILTKESLSHEQYNYVVKAIENYRKRLA